MQMDDADLREYRRTLGAFPTGVAVVTTRAQDGAFAGLTVNSFSSVSLDPPLVLWCIGLWSTSFPIFRDAAHFAINILAQDQEAVARRFASRAADRFSETAVEVSADGLPLIGGCAARLECARVDSHLMGDHAVFIGRVAHFARWSERAPLVFSEGSYACAAARIPADAAA